MSVWRVEGEPAVWLGSRYESWNAAVADIVRLDDYNHQRPHSALGQRTPADASAQARETMAQESSAIAFLEPGTSSKADHGRSDVEVAEDPER